jgi:transcriptional regulator GlxA family with amidase domain
MNQSMPSVDRSNFRTGPMKPPPVSAFAAKAHVSSSFFSGPASRSPMYCFLRLRMQYARQWLESGTASVKDVAAALGYAARFIFVACLPQSSTLRAAIRGWRNPPG